MKKTQNAIIVYHDDSTDQSENETSSPPPTTNTSTALKAEKSNENSIQVKLNDTPATETRATTKAILNLNLNPFYNDKRKWDDSFTIDEKKALEGNIVKAAKDNDGETYVTLQEEVVFAQPPSSQTEESQDSDDFDSSHNKKPGRKPMPDEECFSDPDQDPKVKRKAQNRAAQRAFRERKEKYVKELEIKIKQVQDSHMVTITQLLGENQQLRAIVYKLEMENSNLKGVPFQPYQSELNSIPHHSPLLHQPHQRIGNYPQIAPLISNQAILPAYSPSSPALSTSSVSSIPLQPYPIAPTTTHTPPVKKPIAKKVSTKQQQKPPTNQPLEYTFSISTPASLRPSHSDSSASKQNQSPEPVKLVQLYHPSGKHYKQKTTNSEPSESPVQSEEVYNKHTPNSQNDTSSVVSTESSKRMDQLELDFIDCHIDPEGQSFCKKLNDEVCHDAFNRLLSEPLFDQMGKLNLSIASYPIVSFAQEEGEEEKEKDTTKKPKNKVELTTISHHTKNSNSKDRVFNCQEMWFMLSQHKRFQDFTTDELYEKVKKVAKWSDIGPVLEESDLLKILAELDQK